jgi:hypothetical protein
MRTASTHHIGSARRLAALGAIGLCVLAAAASPALADPARAGRTGAGTTITMRWYSVVVSFVYTRADGTVAQQPPQSPAAGDQMDILELAYKGTHASHARKWSASSHTTCLFKTAGAAPVCEGQSAVGGNQLLLFHTPSDGDPAVSGGTGRFLGATGGAKLTQIGDTNNSDIVVTVHLKK